MCSLFNCVFYNIFKEKEIKRLDVPNLGKSEFSAAEAEEILGGVMTDDGYEIACVGLGGICKESCKDGCKDSTKDGGLCSDSCKEGCSEGCKDSCKPGNK